mmetsp:Transcript_24364/g.58358  ORF Transcript_24364/g.58358 Transcript_24364/m.58358 type:complete len:404 (+) Transcript_24364:413-1624(+)
MAKRREFCCMRSSMEAAVRRCTSSGPSAKRRPRAPAKAAKRGVSCERPIAPCAWMHRSTRPCTVTGMCALTMLSICRVRGSLLPFVSMSSAALYTSSRQVSISHRDFAMSCSMVSKRASFLPNASRSPTRRHMSESARSACPSERMQWWMRPGPSRPCEISKPRPSPSSTFSSGTRTFSKRISMWPLGASSSPRASIGRSRVMPGVSIGTSSCDCCLWIGPSVLVLPMRIMILQCSEPAPVHHHLEPLITYSPRASSRAMEMPMLVASLEATVGSVMAKQERMRPSSSGSSQRRRCSALAYRASTSMLPVSGLVQLHAIAANSAWQLVPMISQISAYCRFVSPPPTTLWSTPATAAESTGRKRFHRPCAFALRLSSIRIGGQCQSCEASPMAFDCAAKSCSFG